MKAKPEIYEALEERGVKYAMRIPANDRLERDIAELLARPVGRPSHKLVVRYKRFLYQAGSWKTAFRCQVSGWQGEIPRFAQNDSGWGRVGREGSERDSSLRSE